MKEEKERRKEKKDILTSWKSLDGKGISERVEKFGKKWFKFKHYYSKPAPKEPEKDELTEIFGDYEEV
jgi:hypothetical protein